MDGLDVGTVGNWRFSGRPHETPLITDNVETSADSSGTCLRIRSSTQVDRAGCTYILTRSFICESEGIY